MTVKQQCRGELAITILLLFIHLRVFVRPRRLDRFTNQTSTYSLTGFKTTQTVHLFDSSQATIIARTTINKYTENKEFV